MCGRFTMTMDSYEQLAQLFGVNLDAKQAEQYRPRYNIAPGNHHWIYLKEKDAPILTPAKWGIVPKWAKDASTTLINARADSVGIKPTFRRSFLSRRCIVPADGFYEWTGDKKSRQPIRIYRPDDPLLRFAGIFEWSKDPKTKNEIRTFTIITTNAQPSLKKIHHRMPVILSPPIAEKWVATPEPSSPQNQKILQDLLEIEDIELETYPVSKRINSPKNDDPACLEPAGV